MLTGTLATAAPNKKIRNNNRVWLLGLAFSTLILAGCASRSVNAPISDHTGAKATQTKAATGTYIVKPGDTLYKIANQHGMQPTQLAQLNNINDPTQLSVGQILRLDTSTAMPMPVKVGSSSSSSSAKPSAAATSSAAPTKAADANVIAWAWPANGKIIQKFDSNTKGIDIEGAIGGPVLAAADGKVMYAGNGVRGLGNLVLLGHSNGFITAYAHNQNLLVKTGETIKKGAKIATIGQSDTTSPRLHFEIRRKGTPVNPLSYLPAK